MEWLLLLAFLLFCAWSALVRPWLNKSAIEELREEIRDLKTLLLPDEDAAAVIRPTEGKKSGEKTEAKIKAKAKETPADDQRKPAAAMRTKQTPKIAEKKKTPSSSAQQPKTSGEGGAGWEQQFGARMPVWMGGIALALAGIFLVKYSIEHELLGPEGRVILGLVSGVVLLLLARYLWGRPDIANAVRITQSLAGAGIVILYASVFAAAGLYHLVQPLTGFAGMAAITVVAVLLSLRYGAPVALLGLVGGYATPAMIQTEDPSAFGLFAYLFVIFAGLIFVMKRQGWWLMSLLAVAAGFIWVALWLETHFTSADGIWLMLFLLGVAALSVWSVWSIPEKTQKPPEGEGVFVIKPEKIVNYAGFGGAVFLMGAVLNRADFGIAEWGMFWLFSAGSLFLAWARPAVYHIAAYAALGFGLLMLLLWNAAPNIFPLPAVFTAFAVLFCGAALTLALVSPAKFFWSRILGISAFGFFVIAEKKPVWIFEAAFFSQDVFFAAAALALAGGAAALLAHLQRGMKKKDGELPKIQAVYVLTAVAFISYGGTVLLDAEWWGTVLAAQILALMWLYARTPMSVLPRIAKILTVLLALMLLPAVLLSFGLFALSGAMQPLTELNEAARFVEMPLLKLGCSGLALVAAGYFLRRVREADMRFVKTLEISGFTLIGAAAYYALRAVLYGGENMFDTVFGFAERGMATALFFALAFVFFAAGRKTGYGTYTLAGICAGIFAVTRVVYFDLLALNPYWSEQYVAGYKIVNMLWLNYALSAAAIYLYRRELLALGITRGGAFLNKVMLTLVLAFVTFQVRHYYHGPVMAWAAAGNAEIYTYSAVWLLTGFAALGIGVWRESEMLRFASLAIVTLTVAKVFLYDAAALEGLYRIFSFFGLGVSLIALSWFYTRFVFQRRGAEKT
ncbi:MAG: DUF2339 domain-containing protein [Micavibrio sp.]|nr:MAG: DUF2339 domain-containing protein [Micavibrio sp.]